MFGKKQEKESTGESPISYTIFDNLWPRKDDTHFHKSSWAELVEFIRDQEKVLYTDKKDCPLISLCKYGTKKSGKGFLRHSQNVEMVYGIELDYDDQEVTPEEAHDLFKKARIKSVIYTSPSYTTDKPKWRALLPLSRAVPPDRRAEMVGKANRVLKGIIARESFTLSQSFYVGHVRKAEYLVYESHGGFIDKSDARPLFPKSSKKDGTGGSFDEIPDDVFIEAFEKGSGRYNAALALSSRWIAKGRDPEKVRKELHKYVRLAEHDGVDPHTTQGENLYKAISRLVDSANTKFGKEAKKLKRVDEEEDEEHDDSQQEEESASEEDDFWLPVQNFKEEPDPQEFVIDEWLTMPNVGLYSAHGGSGKSYTALEISVRVALGISVFGKEVKQGKVFYFSAEDDADVIHRRIRHICKALDVPIGKLEGQLFIRDATKDNTILFRVPKKFDEDGAVTTPRYKMLRKLIKEHDPVLVILDSAVDHYEGNENDRVQVRSFVRKLFRLAQIGNGRNILLLAHVDAGSLKDGEKAKGFSGSTAWHNSVRNLWYQFRDPQDQEKHILQLKKINYGAPGARTVIRFDSNKMVFDLGKTFRPSFARFERRILDVVRNCLDNGEIIPCANVGPKTGIMIIRNSALCPPELAQKNSESKRVIQGALDILVKEEALIKKELKDKKGHKVMAYVLGPSADSLFDEERE